MEVLEEKKNSVIRPEMGLLLPEFGGVGLTGTGTEHSFIYSALKMQSF